MATGRKTGGGSRKGIRNRRTADIEEFARGIAGDAEVRQRMLLQARDGTLPAQVLALVFHYAYGKPIERIEHSGPEGEPLQVSLMRYTDA